MISNITNWFGRGGNNIIQIINCIYYSFYLNNFEKIILPNHILIKVCKIYNKENKQINYENKIINNDFFYARKLGFEIEPYKMREIAQKYLVDIVNINLDKNKNSNNLVIHIRLGDILTNPRTDYIIHPFKLYKQIIEENKYDKYIFIYEKEEFLITELKKINNNKLIFQSSSLVNDIELLCSEQNLLISFSTFSLMIYFLSKNIKHILIPEYIVEEWYINMNWGIKTTLYNLKNYKNKWIKTKSYIEKKEIILNYDDEIMMK